MRRAIYQCCIRYIVTAALHLDLLTGHAGRAAHREAGTIDGHAGANLYASHAAAGELDVDAPKILLLMHPHHFPLPLDNA